MRDLAFPATQRDVLVSFAIAIREGGVMFLDQMSSVDASFISKVNDERILTKRYGLIEARRKEEVERQDIPPVLSKPPPPRKSERPTAILSSNRRTHKPKSSRRSRPNDNR